MAKNKMSDLRDHLFETLELLKDPEKPLDVERAKAICAVSGKIIDSAKTEVLYAKVTGAQPLSEFFESAATPPARPALKGHVNGASNGAAISANGSGKKAIDSPTDRVMQQRVDRDVTKLREDLEEEIGELTEALIEEGFGRARAKEMACKVVADMPDAHFETRLNRAIEGAAAGVAR
jgi:hypothetical protein